MYYTYLYMYIPFIEDLDHLPKKPSGPPWKVATIHLSLIWCRWLLLVVVGVALLLFMLVVVMGMAVVVVVLLLLLLHSHSNRLTV